MKFQSGSKLYEVASMLSPSIYETVFNRQYKSRFDKETFILDCDTFNKYYISENGYKNFINSNISRLGKFINYFGLHQLFDSKIVSFKEQDCTICITIEDKSIECLAKALSKIKSINIGNMKFPLTFLFKGIKHFSYNKLSNKEKLIETEAQISPITYIQDQITYVDKDMIELVIGVAKENMPIKNIEYIIISFESIEIEDKAKIIWKETFKNDLANLYEYFINTRKSTTTHRREYLYENIIEEYQKFLKSISD